MRMMPIASGSSGNCVYVGSDNTHILIDAGVSRKKIEEGLNKIDLSVKDLSAIFVTHEHSDHIKGIGVISRKEAIPIYATQGTIDGILEAGLGDMPEGILNRIGVDIPFYLNDLVIRPFAISHDANEPCAYSITNANKKVSVCTDLGCYDDYTVENLKESDILYVEANHDINLLQVGSYPYYLKQRILGNKGHLCNESSGQLISKVLHPNLKKVILGHLSKDNNYEKLAYETVKLEIDQSENDYKASDFEIEVAKRFETSMLNVI
ncbi:MAG: MBL fold metallo-hydrolase [Lachnospira sp.]|jgi:phosphoribosyl 1,2-cyclic phosphodiesterase|uniref:MBL fold metallo-hydrolase n=1 Tax=Lachnospira sp. TaxID=2049031 RepID=UPI0025795A65|nr:MBL fold metallo-hydrolase [Lachnospira sp.]MBQ2473322.1 MBL fold metallo-hydrolase [Lachnospira sp.]MCR5514891.1 MBL fold metallo-hydrolase [Lachnospira sp.]